MIRFNPTNCHPNRRPASHLYATLSATEKGTR
jgi:hypothetical protein